MLLFDQTLVRCSFAPFNDIALPLNQSKVTADIGRQIGAQDFDIALAPQGTEFQQSVWRALQKIPFGQTCSYADVANAINRPKAVRAVANAVAANPIGWFIPCHRVIRSNGQIGGFAWGTQLKQHMLDWEQKMVADDAT
jgi:O-6-methylguanine DNA methyltransferase